MFQRRHYEAIAMVLASIRPALGDDVSWCDAVEAFCEKLYPDNPRFNVEKFREACLGGTNNA